jgi:nitrogen-specific signal transduction histidine kinase
MEWVVRGIVFTFPGLLPWLLFRSTLENRDSPGGVGLLVMIPAASVYAIAFAVRTVTTTTWLWYGAANIGLAAIASTAVGWFLLTTEFTGYIERPRRALGGFGLLLLIDQIFAWTNPLHHRYYEPIASISLPTAGIAQIGGPLFQLHALGAYLIIFLGILACLSGAISSRGIRRTQNLVLIGAVALPVGANISFFAQLTARNYTSVMFVPAVFILAWVLFEADFFDVVSRGRELAVENIDNPIVIVDENNDVVETNPAARKLVHTDPEFEKMSLVEFFAPVCEQFKLLDLPGELETEITITQEGGQRYFDLRSSRLKNEADAPGGWVITLHEITQVKRREQALQQLHTKTATIVEEEERSSICSAAVSAINDVLGIAEVGVYFYNRRQEALIPVDTTEAFDELWTTDQPECESANSLLWAVYESGTNIQLTDRRALERVFPEDDGSVERALLLPLGTHGLLVIPAVTPTTLSEIEANFARLLSTSIETALDKARREQGLKTVQTVSRDALTATTTDEMVETVLSQLPETLDFPLAAIWEYDSPTHQLQPVGSTGPADSLFDETPVFTPGNSIAWRAFQEQETKLISSISDYPDAYDSDSVIRSEVISPIDGFGVFAAGSLHAESFTENEQQILASLSTNLQAAAQLIERRRDMRLLDQVLGRILRHNLRNELTVIKGYAQQIEDEPEESPPIGKNIIEAADRLEKTTANAQTMREVVSNRDDTTTVALTELVTDAVDTVQDEFPSAEIHLNCATAVTVTAHPNIHDAVRQLIRNGIEHNTSVVPTVDVQVFETEGGPKIEVADNGPGIPRNELTVLDKHGESALEHGSGAGLWVIDRVATYSNIALEFSTDSGTTASLTF